jgi:hypothetical protein
MESRMGVGSHRTTNEHDVDVDVDVDVMYVRQSSPSRVVSHDVIVLVLVDFMGAHP